MNNILLDLYNDLPIVKFRGFYNCVLQKETSPEVIQQLRILKSDNRRAAGRRMCEYAEAVLHLLNAEEYTGDNKDVWQLIETRMGQIDNNT